MKIFCVSGDVRLADLPFPLTPALSLGEREKSVGTGAEYVLPLLGERAGVRGTATFTSPRFIGSQVCGPGNDEQSRLRLCQAGAGEVVELASWIVSVDEPGICRMLRGWVVTELESQNHALLNGVAARERKSSMRRKTFCGFEGR